MDNIPQSKPHYILTIDVGTKNLAMCLSSYTCDIPTQKSQATSDIISRINLIDWNILDITTRTLQCSQMKARSVCTCPSKYYSIKNPDLDPELLHSEPTNLNGYCKSHAKIFKKSMGKNKILTKTKLYPTSSNPNFDNNFTTQMTKLVVKLDDYFCNVISKPYGLCADGSLKYIENLDVYIENQPVLTNPIMKSIGVGIYIYFCVKVQSDKRVQSVKLINPTVKTKDSFVSRLDALFGIKDFLGVCDLKTYTNRKDYSTNVVNGIIGKLACDVENVNNCGAVSNYVLAKKKDDYADTFLYLLYVIICMIHG